MNRALLTWYARRGRHDLPWRRDPTPYRVLVSEFMLQQTQVERVIPIFDAFVLRFPDFETLAAAQAAEVVRAWRGLGYNTRAVRLQRVARAVVDRHEGRLPRERDALLALPGVGPYTASAIRAFAFDADDVALDTNLRRIVHRVRFGLEIPPRASAREIDEAAGAMLARGRSFAWNSAMMDLGATVCTSRAPKCLLCPLRERCAAAPVDGANLAALREKGRSPGRPRFEETSRYARGRIVDFLRELPPGSAISLLDLHSALRPQLGTRELGEICDLVGGLERDGVVHCADEQVRLA
ncbi:MAG TPA: A/G-specific adenine glycosylase [Candidatus Acidoferrales bacterium]|nr:A/G-specific adenine glycosylase [Candidatus Acidoferrales bacterium]